MEPTPGPWKAVCFDAERIWWVVMGDRWGAMVGPGPACEADAKLMAAAPDLFAACVAIRAALPADRPWTEAENMIVAAVAKAAGEFPK